MKLRWIEINGEKKLQYIVQTMLESGEIISMRWEDVPVVSMPEKKATITATHIDNILDDGREIFLNSGSSLHDMSAYFKKKLGLL